MDGPKSHNKLYGTHLLAAALFWVLVLAQQLVVKFANTGDEMLTSLLVLLVF